MLTFNNFPPEKPGDITLDFDCVASCQFPIQTRKIGEVIGGTILNALPLDAGTELPGIMRDEVARQAATSGLKKYWRLNFMQGVDGVMPSAANQAETAQAQHIRLAA